MGNDEKKTQTLSTSAMVIMEWMVGGNCNVGDEHCNVCKRNSKTILSKNATNSFQSRDAPSDLNPNSESERSSNLNPT